MQPNESFIFCSLQCDFVASLTESVTASARSCIEPGCCWVVVECLALGAVAFVAVEQRYVTSILKGLEVLSLRIIESGDCEILLNFCFS